MQTLKSFHDVIGLWPTKAALRRDLENGGGKRAHVQEWHRRNKIPPAWFEALIAAAEKRGFEGVTYPTLSRLYNRPDTAAPSEVAEII